MHKKPFTEAYNVTYENAQVLNSGRSSSYDVTNPFSLPNLWQRRGFLRENREVVIDEITGEQMRAERRGGPGVYVGLRNLGQSCYLSSFIQTLFMNLDFRRNVFQLYADKLSPEETPVLYHLARLFAFMQKGDLRVADPSPLAHALQLSGQTQEDPTELASIFFARIEAELERRNLSTAILDLFRGQAQFEIVCKECGGFSIREEPFRELRVQPPNLSSPKKSRVKSKSATVSRETSTTGRESPAVASPSVVQKRKQLKSMGIDKLIAATFRKEQLRGSNRFFCTACNALVDASRSGRLTQLPSYLNVCIERSTFDARAGERVKNLVIIDAASRLVLESGARTGSADATEAAAETVTYELVGILEHIGLSAHHGHYRAKLKSQAGSQSSQTQSPQSKTDVEPSPSPRETDRDDTLSEKAQATLKQHPKRRKLAKGKSCFERLPDYSLWLNFDDHLVTPLRGPPGSLTATRPWQASSESAYLFVYRREDLPLVDDSDFLPESLEKYVQDLIDAREGLERAYDSSRQAASSFVEKTVAKVERFETETAACYRELRNSLSSTEDVLDRMVLVPLEWLKAAAVGLDCLTMRDTLPFLSSPLKLSRTPGSVLGVVKAQSNDDRGIDDGDGEDLVDMRWFCCHTDGTPGRGGIDPMVVAIGTFKLFPLMPLRTLLADPTETKDLTLESLNKSLLDYPLRTLLTLPASHTICQECADAHQAAIELSKRMVELFTSLKASAVEDADLSCGLLREPLSSFDASEEASAIEEKPSQVTAATEEFRTQLSAAVDDKEGEQPADEPVGMIKNEDITKAEVNWRVLGSRSMARLESFVSDKFRAKRGGHNRSRKPELDRHLPTLVRRDIMTLRIAKVQKWPPEIFQANSELLCKHQLRCIMKATQVIYVDGEMLDDFYGCELKRCDEIMKMVKADTSGLPRFAIDLCLGKEDWNKLETCQDCTVESRSQLSRRNRSYKSQGQFEMLMHPRFLIRATPHPFGRRNQIFLPAEGTQVIVTRSWLNDWRANLPSNHSTMESVSPECAVNAVRAHFSRLAECTDDLARQLWWKSSFLPTKADAGFFVVHPETSNGNEPAFVPEEVISDTMPNRQILLCRVGRVELSGAEIFNLSEPLPYREDGGGAKRVLSLECVAGGLDSHDLIVVFQTITENGNRRLPTALMPIGDSRLLYLPITSDTRNVLNYVFVTFDIARSDATAVHTHE